MSAQPNQHNITIASGGLNTYLVMPGTPRENKLTNTTAQYVTETGNGTIVFIWVVGCVLTEAEALIQARSLLGQLR